MKTCDRTGRGVPQPTTSGPHRTITGTGDGRENGAETPPAAPCWLPPVVAIPIAGAAAIWCGHGRQRGDRPSVVPPAAACAGGLPGQRGPPTAREPAGRLRRATPCPASPATRPRRGLVCPVWGTSTASSPIRALVWRVTSAFSRTRARVIVTAFAMASGTQRKPRVTPRRAWASQPSQNWWS